LGETLDYYAGETFIEFLIGTCRVRRVVMVISTTKHWEPNWTEDEVRISGLVSDAYLAGESDRIESGEIEDVRQMVLAKIQSALPGLGRDGRPDFYPSFHQSVWKSPAGLDGPFGRPQGGGPRDCVFESDPTTWREAFQDVYSIVDRMDRHSVPYMLKFSGHRSLHVVLPAETIPKGYREKRTAQLAKRLLAWSGSRAHHLPQITRMPYSLNEDTGLVCLPIARGALAGFRPWQANLHLAEVRREDWPDGTRTALDARAVAASDVAQARLVALLNEIEPRAASRGPTGHDRDRDEAVVVHYVPDLGRIQASAQGSPLPTPHDDRPEALAWRLLASNDAIAEGALLDALRLDDVDARWLTVEAYLLRGSTLGRETFMRLLEEDEEYVQPAATDVLLRFEDAIFDDLVDMVGALDRHPTAGSKAAQLLTLSASLRARVVEAVVQRTERSPDALAAAACLVGSMGGGWRAALEIVQPLRDEPELPSRHRTRLGALDLMSELGGWNKKEEARKARALTELGPEITDLLLIAAGSPNRRYRRSIVGALAMLADPRAVDLLVHALGDEFSQIRRKAIPGLIEIGEPAVDRLIEAASSDQVPVRRYALLCLGYISAPRARPALLEGLDDSEINVRKSALKGLKNLAQTEDIPRLQRAMREDVWEHAQWAAEAIAATGDAGLEALQRMALEERNPAAAHHLAVQGDSRGREILAELLADETQREAAAEFLRDLKDERCIPFFAEVLETTTHWRGAFVAHELGRIGTPEAVAVLIQALSRDSTYVRRGALHGLREARDPASCDILIRCFYDEDRKARGLAADALVAIGPPAADAVREALAEGRIEGQHRVEAAEEVIRRVGPGD
jgi:HEAT repeat protein